MLSLIGKIFNPKKQNMARLIVAMTEHGSCLTRLKHMISEMADSCSISIHKKTSTLFSVLVPFTIITACLSLSDGSQ